ncbi:hypothetical protein PUN4_910052 [Paraburkholderia unamae]|nr:hypothetical protein PUN4_910052 [Paraburkholderia unamae]
MKRCAKPVTGPLAGHVCAGPWQFARHARNCGQKRAPAACAKGDAALQTGRSRCGPESRSGRRVGRLHPVGVAGSCRLAASLQSFSRDIYFSLDLIKQRVYTLCFLDIQIRHFPHATPRAPAGTGARRGHAGRSERGTARRGEPPAQA